MLLWNTIWVWPFLMGLVPVLLARTWRARRVAILFGMVSLACAAWYITENRMASGTQDGLRRIGLPAIGALITALTSLILTYVLDTKHGTRP